MLKGAIDFLNVASFILKPGKSEYISNVVLPNKSVYQ